MTVFVCVDDNFGMTFNNRRQSRDSAVIEKIKEMKGENKLYIRPFSAKMLNGEDYVVADDMLDSCQKGDFCFVEDADLSQYSQKISTVVLFKWNREYPFDKKMTLSFDGWKLDENFDFVGTSHEKITCEVWKK